MSECRAHRRGGLRTALINDRVRWRRALREAPLQVSGPPAVWAIHRGVAAKGDPSSGLVPQPPSPQEGEGKINCGGGRHLARAGCPRCQPAGRRRYVPGRRRRGQPRGLPLRRSRRPCGHAGAGLKPGATVLLPTVRVATCHDCSSCPLPTAPDTPSYRLSADFRRGASA